MRAIVITGAPGAGKSSALTALTDAVGSDGVEHVTVELDDLSRGWPWRYPPAGFAALKAFMSVQRTQLLLIAATLTSEAEVEGLLDAIGCDDHFLVRLHARPETLLRRVRAREVIPWAGLDALLERTPGLQETIATLPGVHLALQTDTATPQDLARAILARRAR